MGKRLIAVALGLIMLAAGLAGTPRSASASDGKLDPRLRAQLADGPATFWAVLRDTPGPAAARGSAAVYRAKTAAVDRHQAGLRRLLSERRAPFTPYWIVDTIRITGDAGLAAEVAARPEVSAVLADRVIEMPRPAPGTERARVQDVEWNIARIGAPRVWSELGSRGTGTVVANIDTGVQFDHPALAASYRGRAEDGGVNHDYNWFDPSAMCADSAPCDNHGHGTHTMGTMVGVDIGVAPGAKWIAAKGCETSSCSAGALLAAGQWIVAPTDRAGRNPRPDLAPDIVNNSWGGSGSDPWYQQIVAAWVAAGIFPAFSAGNAGPGCASGGTPGNYTDSYSSGALDSADTIAGFSSRGGSVDGEVKPDIAAPGVDVRSSVPGGYSSFSGTSMASPHTAGTVALLWSAAPGLRRNIAATRQLLDLTATDTADTTCGGSPEDNNVYGEGRLNAYAAVSRAGDPPPSATIGGTVSGPGGPIAAAPVSLVGAGTSTRTDAAGQYRLTAPEGHYVLRVRPAWGCLGGEERQVDVVGEVRADVVLRPRTDAAGHSCGADDSTYPAGTQRVEVTGDDTAAEIALPFSFDHYGTSYRQAWVSSNGVLSFAGPDTGFLNRALPDAAAPNAALYPFWDDLFLDDQSGVYTATTGETFVVEWRNAAFFADRTQRVSFSAELRADGSVTYRYRGLAGVLADGRSATIGIENADGRDGLAYAQDAAGAVTNGGGVAFRPPPAIEARFHVTTPTTWGQQVLLVGNLPVLGGWNPAGGLALDPGGYPVWSGATGLPPNTAVEFKYVIRNPDGSIVWEDGANRTTVTPPTGRFETHDTFNQR
ncbi:S8 family serine peptidase [Actinoplanes sp. NPDC049118]|uniref:S8 family serine peptidase n=1 Tax=Actinoplanes sp. NPDC049118 TaxID=3155769 RepID=UPI0033F8F5EE